LAIAAVGAALVFATVLAHEQGVDSSRSL